MIVRTLVDQEDRYTVVTNDKTHLVLISTQCYSTACIYERYAQKNIYPETMYKFQQYLLRHRKYWRDGFEGLLEEAGLKQVYDDN